ncbi:MAG: PEGA domain-containing protein [Proteobacteria bacterium]|nr:PEGA domain-containing protein [Pseudomonadota bacterium]
MLPRRIIAISPDKTVGKAIAIALKAAGGVVDLHASLDELGKEIAAALVVVHVPAGGEASAIMSTLVSRLTGDTRAVAILAASDLATIVAIMQASDRVAGMLVAEDLDPRELSAMATRILAGDIFGLDKVIRWGTQIHSQLIGDYQEKSLCISQISEFAELMGVRRKYRESIEQCIDEMLMNALYDAPVDDDGKQIFAEIPTKTRISLRVEQKVVVQYACDGKQFAVSVRDAFGTLERATVLRYLHKCLHNANQIDRKVGGAGLGLYLMTNASSEVYFNVLPKVATEAVCVFDLESPKLQLQSFGFFHERIDAGGRLVGGPSRRLPTGASHPVERRDPSVAAPSLGRGVVALLVVMIGVVLALIAMVAYPRLRGDDHFLEVRIRADIDDQRVAIRLEVEPVGATVELDGKAVGTATAGALVVRDLVPGRAYPIVVRHPGFAPKSTVVQPTKAGDDRLTLRLDALVPTVRLDSLPTGATIEVDGKPVGTAPLVLSSLAPRAPIELTFRKPGYRDATTKLEVPGPGEDLRVVQPLLVSDELARIHLVSEPPGAQVVQNGQLVPGILTPAEVLVEAGKPVSFTLTMAHKVPVQLATFTPGHGETNLEQSATLVDGRALAITSSVEGKVSVAHAPLCQALTTPASCVVPPGTYSVELVVGPTRFTHQIAVTADLAYAFELGYVTPPPGSHLQLADLSLSTRVLLEAGPRQVLIVDDAAPRVVTVVVKPGATVVAR